MYMDKTLLLPHKGYFEGTTGAVDESTALVTAAYKKNICRSFISLNPEQIDSRIAGENFYITRKYDGELNLIFFNGTDTFTINTGGKVRMGIPCIEEAGTLLKKAGIRSAIIPAELYVCEKDGRTRVFDVLSVLSKDGEAGRLCLAPFDIIELNGEPLHTCNYEETYRILESIFNDSVSARQVLYRKAGSKAEVADIFRQWVENDRSEGIIVRSELPFVYKVKPRHTIDVVIIGFTEGTWYDRGKIRTLLFALMDRKGHYQVAGKTGSGLGEEQKKDLYGKLSTLCTESEYTETDSSHVAFRMVKPEVVMELSFNDILFENTTARITNPLLEIRDGRYKIKSFCNGISLILPAFVRIRDDKKADETGVRLSQVTDLTYVPDFECKQDSSDLPQSEIILRAVYKKESGGKLMVQKFLVWKTNKETLDGLYTAYVMHYTNFSSDRRDPLQRDIRVSNDRGQIMAITEAFIRENVKKGWVKV